MFYNISTYREFYLTTAQLPESILNLSAFLGYNTSEAEYSQVDVFVTVPFGFDNLTTTTIVFPKGFKFYAGTTEFITDYNTTITVINNQNVSILVEDAENQKAYNVPVNLTTEEFSFLLTVKQYKETEQTFQIDEDLPAYQFVTVEVPLTGQVSTLNVEIQNPDSSEWVPYTESSSLYLMSATDTKYVSRRTSTGRKLYFGNGIIGVQPLPGSTVKVKIRETLGERGNIISTSITRGDRVYTTVGSVTKILNYTVTNTAPGTGGKDEESLEEVRSNSIASLTALHRLVSESDYINAKVVLEDTPIADNSLPVLKRSDLKVNEIQLFTTLLFGSDLVPTRDACHITNNIVDGEWYVPRNAIINVDNDSTDYYNIFDITTDKLNKVAYYHYIMYELEVIPYLVKSDSTTFIVSLTNLLVKKVGDTGTFDLSYFTTEDSTSCECEMVFEQDGKKHAMTNDTVNSKFTFIFSNYIDIPEGELDVNFRIYRPSLPVATQDVSHHTANLTFRTPLNAFMMSSIILGDSTSYPELELDSTSCMIFDIPVVKASYYDDLDEGEKRAFELQVLQAIISGTNFESRRMLTDFINLKFANTYGILKNMQLNTVTKSSPAYPVKDIDIDVLPITPEIDEQYIFSKNLSKSYGDWEGSTLARWDGSVWSKIDVVTDDIVYVESKKSKYIYSEGQWVVPNYRIPIEIEIEVIKSRTYAGSQEELSNNIKSALMSAFQDRFGSNVSLYRSQIIDVVHNVSGVSHCRVVKPESSIFYNFNLNTLDDYELVDFKSTSNPQIKLLLYGPEYTFFNEDNIVLKII
jgi:hypothetical protein